MLKSLIATGWRRLAIVLLVIWEAYWSIEWNRAKADVARLLAADFVDGVFVGVGNDYELAAAHADKLFTILIASPVIALLMFLAGKWVAAGFRKNLP